MKIDISCFLFKVRALNPRVRMKLYLPISSDIRTLRKIVLSSSFIEPVIAISVLVLSPTGGSSLATVVEELTLRV